MSQQSAVWPFGQMLAMAISWNLYHSLWWTILHGLFGWFYVIYFALRRTS